MKKKYQPARRVITRWASVGNGRFPSFKMGRSIDYESPVESDFLFLAEFDRDVIAIWEQPETVEIVINGKSRKKTPDFKLLMRDGSVQIHEVKPEKKANEPENQLAFRLLASLYAERGQTYQVSVDTDIRTEPRLGNIKRLARYRKVIADRLRYLWLSQLLDEVGAVTIVELEQGVHGQVLSKAMIFGAIFRGELEVDIDSPICRDSLVFQGVNPAKRFQGIGGKA
ncbi:MAG: TnsA endonuclease N-terminal domain-containing protein [Sedimenticola sp.]